MSEEFSDIKIIIAAHKKYKMPGDSVYLPLQVGAAGKPDLGYARDDSGDSISAKNPNFCELTGIYWAWKNLHADVIGLTHYRRYFTRRETFGCGNKWQQILTRDDWQSLFSHSDVVVPDKRKYYIETNLSHYNHAHHPEGLETTRQIIAERHGSYLAPFDAVMNRTWAHMFNMFAMKRGIYSDYCEWLFGVLFELESRLDISSYDKYESRVFGFVSELLLDVWLEKNKIPYREQNVSFMEPQNWIKKGGGFLARKVFGRKSG